MASLPADSGEQPFPVAYMLVGIVGVLGAWLASMVAGAFVPAWRAGMYLPVAVVVVGEVVLVREAIAREAPSKMVIAAIRARELLTMLLLVVPISLIIRYLPTNPVGLVDMALNIWFDPAQYIDARDFLTVALLLGAWAFPIYPLDLLERLVIREADLPKRKALDLYDDLTARRSDLPNLDITLGHLRHWAIFSVIVFATGAAVAWHAFGVPQQILVAGCVMVCAILATAILSLGNFEARRSRWRVEGIVAEGESAERWAFTSGTVGAFLVVAALLIPAAAVLAAMRWFLGGLLFLFSLLTHSFGQAGTSAGHLSGPTMPPILPRLPMPQPHPAQNPATAPGWMTPVLLILASLVVALGVVLFARWMQRSGRGPRVRLLGLMRRLRDIASALSASLRAWLHRLHGALQQIQQVGREQQARVVSRFFGRPRNWSGSNSEIVRYWFGRTVRHGEQAGVTRLPGETAKEYRARVVGHVPEADEPLTGLSEAYVAARYSGQDVSPEAAAAAQRQARAIRETLGARGRRFQHRQSKPSA